MKLAVRILPTRADGEPVQSAAGVSKTGPGDWKV
jgi:hypothetical protein